MTSYRNYAKYRNFVNIFSVPLLSNPYLESIVILYKCIITYHLEVKMSYDLCVLITNFHGHYKNESLDLIHNKSSNNIPVFQFLKVTYLYSALLISL